MPIRTEIVISIGEILECLPPGKSYRKRSCLDEEELGNQENVAPGLGSKLHRCPESLASMKQKENGNSDSNLDPRELPIRRTRYSVDGRKHSADLDDADDDDEITFNSDSLSNGDLLASSKPKSKRKSSAEKFLEDNSNYFQLEVLAAKTRSSKIVDDSCTSASEAPAKQDFHNSFLDFLKAKGVEGKVTEQTRSRHKSGPACHRNGDDYSPSPARSDSTESPRLQRSEAAESPRPHRVRRQTKPRSMSRLRSRSRDFSLSESEPDTNLPRKDNCSLESSDDESSNASSGMEKRSSKSSNSLSPGKRSRRSELDKLLEAVDTSFHFETAAAAAKRMNDSQSELGPLEIDVSDSNLGSEEENSRMADDRFSENAEENTPSSGRKGSTPGRKRKHSEVDGIKEKLSKRRLNRGNLLKTFSPGGDIKKRPEWDVDNSESMIESISEKLSETDGSPVGLQDIYFSFECPPSREAWFQTYSRQDRGDDVVYYPDSKIFPFVLPYELPLSTFMTCKPEIKTETKIKKEKRDTPSFSKKIRSAKISESESTDSENNNRRLKSKFGLKTEHLQDLQPRISPRCHASTKEDSNFSPYTNGYDETSNDSLSSVLMKSVVKQENTEDYISVSSEIDTFFKTSSGIKVPEAGKPGKEEALPNVPTRSRISSDQLLKNMKPKKKKEKRASAEVIMDNFVTENIDSMLLDLLEEELPTVPLELNQSDVLSLVTSYQSCNSMNVCNSRWLRPSRPSIPGETGAGKSSTPKKHHFPNSNKPKRLVIYKEDLPGFKFDNDIESEKLPISKRTLAKKSNEAAKKESDPVKKEPEDDEAEEEEEEEEEESEAEKEEEKEIVKSKPRKDKKETKLTSPRKEPKSLSGTKKTPKKDMFVAKKSKMKKDRSEKLEKVETKEEKVDEDDDDNSSEASSASTSSRKKRINKTGFPPTKKKKIKLEKKKDLKKKSTSKKDDANTPKKDSSSPKSGKSSAKSPKISKEDSESTPPKPAVKKVKKKVSIKKSPSTRSSPESPRQSRSGHSSLGRRSTTLKSKNYSELESDTESLLEAKVPYRSPHMKAALMKQQQLVQTKNSKTKLKSRAK